jgi:hypothetical protein
MHLGRNPPHRHIHLLRVNLAVHHYNSAPTRGPSRSANVGLSAHWVWLWQVDPAWSATTPQRSSPAPQLQFRPLVGGPILAVPCPLPHQICGEAQPWRKIWASLQLGLARLETISQRLCTFLPPPLHRSRFLVAMAWEESCAATPWGRVAVTPASRALSLNHRLPARVLCVDAGVASVANWWRIDWCGVWNLSLDPVFRRVPWARLIASWNLVSCLSMMSCGHPLHVTFFRLELDARVGVWTVSAMAPPSGSVLPCMCVVGE